LGYWIFFPPDKSAWLSGGFTTFFEQLLPRKTIDPIRAENNMVRIILLFIVSPLLPNSGCLCENIK
jgi:hypothetical protein